MYAEIVFPLKLPPLTYRIPDDAPTDLVGRIVKAPLQNKNIYGLIISVRDESGIKQQKDIKKITSIYQHFTYDTGISFISLLKWLSDYYLMPMGTALKSCFFDEIVESQRAKSKKQTSELKPTISTSYKYNMNDQNISIVRRGILNKNYQTFLLQAPSTSYENLFVSEIFNEKELNLQRAIILVPEIGQIERLSSSLSGIFGERLCILHSKLSKSKRIETIRKIVSGNVDIIVGTRSAILAPLNNISFIAVLGEHNPSYKAEEGLRYNSRDVAVMRGFIEKSCVLLSSICPSIESVYNAKIGKYIPLNPEGWNQAQNGKRQKIKIFGTNAIRQKDSYISKEILQEAKRLLQKKEKLLFIGSRSGYSIIICNDCNEIFRCEKCRIPLVFYKSKGMLRCNYCGVEKKADESCRKCKGFNISTFGAGTERIKDEVEKFLKIEGTLLEKKTKGLRVKNYGIYNPEISPFVVGTTYISKKSKEKIFSSAVLLNMDSMLSRPDFRAYERIFQEVMHISQLIKPDGNILIQTHDTQNIIWKFIKNYDFNAFYNYEILQRRSLNYPPFSKMILFNIAIKNKSEAINDIHKKLIVEQMSEVDILMNMDTSFVDKSNRQCSQILLKSKNRRALHITAKNLLSDLKKIKGIKLTVDVDPIKI